jgi:outer membrane protein OmpA-like peptidoglycan-associated protein
MVVRDDPQPETKAGNGQERETTMTKNGFRFALAIATLATVGATGCATKKYVKTQTAPLVEHTDRLDQQTGENSRQIRDVDQRAQSGIQHAQGAADTASQQAQNASQQAGVASTAANNAVHRADSLESVVKGLDNYKQMGNVAITFGFDKAELTRADREQLDQFAAQIGQQGGYVLEVTGGTDSVGSSEYNYELSQRRADAVVRYLAAKHGIPAHRFYLIGIGKDKAVASNRTASGRKQNRRVEVALLANQGLSQLGSK